MQPILKTIGIEMIDPNPFRCLDTYPWIEAKIETLMRSINDVGFWEGVIVRKHGDRYQLAFGHHRVEAAKRSGMDAITVIHRELTDEEMLKFMGRENGEDYSTEFLVMLNTWEGAVEFIGGAPPIRVAEILGWVRRRNDCSTVRMNDTADACAAAHELIVGGYLNREHLIRLSVSAARDVCTRASARMKQADKAAAVGGKAEPEVKKAKEAIAKGAKVTAKKIREGEIPVKEAATSVDVEAYKASGSKRPLPEFPKFGKALANTIGGFMWLDATSEKLEAVCQARHLIRSDEDRLVMERLDHSLEKLEKRCAAWRRRLSGTSSTERDITPDLKAIEGGKR